MSITGNIMNYMPKTMNISSTFMNQAPSALKSTGHYFQIQVSSIKSIIKAIYNTEKQEEGTLTWKKRSTNNGGWSNQRRTVWRSQRRYGNQRLWKQRNKEEREEEK
ncbi:unnamed protein product [Vicia faba]|uniref:Uncharacterized protein n=1 Tax=Vicia faba TaxID=3906 RepID=A0AAV1B538_VICFA|nr:unnamed protein product [Vicia faba]